VTGDRGTVTADELRAILAQDAKRQGVEEDRLQEYAVAALATLRGLSRTDKLKVIRRMAKMLRP
jgi:hypothetical protein